jgi:hypothetical protein
MQPHDAQGMTAEQVRELVDWMKQEIRSDSNVYAAIHDQFTHGRATGMSDVISRMRQMGVVVDAES